MKSKRNKRSKSTGLDISALRFIKVGLVFLDGEQKLFVDSLDYNQPISAQELCEEVDYNTEEDEILVGMIALTTDKIGVVQIHTDLSAGDREFVLSVLHAEVGPLNTTPVHLGRVEGEFVAMVPLEIIPKVDNQQ